MSGLPLNQIIHGDCLEVMRQFPDKSIDMILCDLPYGTTACKWDTVIPFEPLWEMMVCYSVRKSWIMGDSKYNPAEIDKENRELDEFYGSRKKVRWSLQEIIEKYGPTYKKLKDYISGQKHPTESNNLSGIREEYDEKDCD